MTGWAAFWLFLAVCAMVEARNARQWSAEQHERKIMAIRAEIDAAEHARYEERAPDGAPRH